MNTRSRSAAAKTKKEESKAPETVKKEREEIVIESEEDEVEEVDDDDEPEFKPKSAGKKQQAKSAKKEPKPRVKKAEPKKAANKEPKVEQETLEDEWEGGLHYELNDKEMKEVNHAFDMNHPDDGEELLDADGLRTAIRSLGFEPRGDEIQKLIKRFAKRGKVNREGFHKIMAQKYGSSPGLTHDNSAHDEISRVFNLLDLDKTGFITLDNLRSIAKELNEELDDEELLEMITEADTDGDKKIDKEDFQRIMIKTNLY